MIDINEARKQKCKQEECAPQIIVKDADVEQEVATMSAEDIAEKRHEGVKTLPQYRGDVFSRNNISSLPNLEVGNIFWATKNNKSYIVSEISNDNVVVKALDENATLSTGLTVYDLNKQMVSKEPLFDWSDEQKIEILNTMLQTWLIENDNKLYMMYGRLLNYFTVFSYERDGQNIMGILKELLDEKVGKLISVDCDEAANCIEIWIRTDKSKAELLYLFPFDKCVVEI